MAIHYKNNEQIVIEIKKLMLETQISQREIAEKLGIKPLSTARLHLSCSTLAIYSHIPAAPITSAALSKIFILSTSLLFLWEQDCTRSRFPSRFATLSNQILDKRINKAQLSFVRTIEHFHDAAFEVRLWL